VRFLESRVGSFVKVSGLVRCIVGGALVCAVALPAHGEGGGVSRSVAFGNAGANWKLTNVFKSGSTQGMQSKEGVLKRQFVIGADADAGAQALFPKARLQLTIDVFAPAKNMAGRVKGKWYVHGTWKLEPVEQAAAVSDEGALTGPLTGRVQAELPFDPTISNKKWKGIVQIPMIRVRADNVSPGVRPLRGGGEIVFDTDGTGSLSVNLKLWPKL
jgi:hypothetical protein